PTPSDLLVLPNFVLLSAPAGEAEIRLGYFGQGPVLEARPEAWRLRSQNDHPGAALHRSDQGHALARYILGERGAEGHLEAESLHHFFLLNLKGSEPARPMAVAEE